MTKIPANSKADEIGSMLTAAQEWFKRTFIDIFRQLRWSFLPPLMVYFAAGISGLTAIVGTFFVKEYLGLSAAFLAALTFWAGLPWALKMPLGHLVDLVWRWKALLVYLGAALIAASLGIMYALIMHTEAMRQLLSVEAWFVVSSLLAPAGYVVQDTVADAMTVEAVPRVRADGQPLSEEETKALHTTMQTLGRIALIGGLVFVALLNIVMFAGVESLEQKPEGRCLRPHLPDGARHPSGVSQRRGAVPSNACRTREATSRAGG